MVHRERVNQASRGLTPLERDALLVRGPDHDRNAAVVAVVQRRRLVRHLARAPEQKQSLVVALLYDVCLLNLKQIKCLNYRIVK